jgi:hypothetical protein
MATAYQSPAERIEARNKARAAKVATQRAKQAAYYRISAERLRATGSVEAAERADGWAQTLEALLIESCRCIRCGRVLTASAHLGIGPECAKRVS